MVKDKADIKDSFLNIEASTAVLPTVHAIPIVTEATESTNSQTTSEVIIASKA